ncbi:peptidase M76 family-domain-containing protein [Pilobolus umbonatus]|nr:peptidase M76 family-domain-containing protein [Pilobolus umbonatus]
MDHNTRTHRQGIHKPYKVRMGDPLKGGEVRLISPLFLLSLSLSLFYTMIIGDKQPEPYSERKCTEELESILKESPKVRALLYGIQTLNRNALKSGISCRACKGTTQESRMGYYDTTYKRVVLCCDHIKTREEIEHTLVHELTHAFDSCRTGQFKTVYHRIACGEVRASALGQCAPIMSQTHRYSCIWNDAVRSTEIHCGTKTAIRIVNEVFMHCIQDKSPFH